MGKKIRYNSRVIYILWLRQIKKHFRSKARVLGSIGQPMLFLVALGFGFGPIYAKASGENFIQFLAPGIIAMSILFTAMFSGISLIYDKQFGFLKETLVAPISRLTIMLGRTMGGATVAVFQGVIVFLLAMLVGFYPTSWSMVFVALVFMVLIALLFTTLGTALASFLNDMQAFPIIMNFIIMPLFFLSGALFPLSNLPAGIRIAINLNPLSYGVDGVRAGLTGFPHYSFTVDFIVLIIVTFILLLIGAKLFQKQQI